MLGIKGKGKFSEVVEVTGAGEEFEEGEILPEELELHEPYIPYYVEKIQRNEEIEECKDTEFIDEFAYDDDCMGAKDGVIQNLE